MADVTRLNYEELTRIIRLLQQEHEEIARLHTQTRHKVDALSREWIGVAADRFFDQMSDVLLPATGRLANALEIAGTTLSAVMKTIQDADLETRSYFKQLGAEDANPRMSHGVFGVQPSAQGVMFEGGKGAVSTVSTMNLNGAAGLGQSAFTNGTTQNVGSSFSGSFSIGAGPQGAPDGAFGQAAAGGAVSGVSGHILGGDSSSSGEPNGIGDSESNQIANIDLNQSMDKKAKFWSLLSNILNQQNETNSDIIDHMN